MARYDFASDNVAGAMPEALAALNAANDGAASGYGTDHVTARAADLIREALDADAEVRFTASGTAANAVALACLAQPHESVLAHEHAHVCTDETGAPGFFGSGVGLIGLPGPSGRIDGTALTEALAQPDVSYRQPAAALSLTNATEYGTVYSGEALKALIDPVKARGYGVHLDGARLANAVAAGFSLRGIKALGVDILVMGGTKAGSTPTEAMVIFDRTLARRFDARLKHAGQLVSKGRFLSAPWIGMLESGAWSGRAAHANAMAQRLAALMPFPILHPVEANGLFVEMDEPTLERLRQSGWFVYRFLDGSVRFMCSWATTAEMVDELGAALKSIR
ncbi:threonine aldolase [Caulobacter ginsengisoli]|uniref:Threonine aldolase n=1 Tax=Caulobacter ginsengisoli TaxID=400775 RepID=A0ABU0IQZ9_9CAUL|nr:low specificity L-threonine aldolase [Caulobacter ginsengisoli]MDQ0464440.1 threonine aldolase [Caulobacter ginsengisoli]